MTPFSQPSTLHLSLLLKDCCTSTPSRLGTMSFSPFWETRVWMKHQESWSKHAMQQQVKFVWIIPRIECHRASINGLGKKKFIRKSCNVTLMAFM